MAPNGSQVGPQNQTKKVEKTIADPVHGSECIYTNFPRGRDRDFTYTYLYKRLENDLIEAAISMFVKPIAP